MKPEQNPSTKYPQISTAQPTEIVLKQFVADLSISIRIIEDLLPNLPKASEQNNRKMALSELTQATLLVNQNIASVIDYLNSRLKNNISEADNIAKSILVRFTHELREQAAPLMGYVTLCEQGQLSEDRLEYFINVIVNRGKDLTKLFKILDKNWQTWLETKDFE